MYEANKKEEEKNKIPEEEDEDWDFSILSHFYFLSLNRQFKALSAFTLAYISLKIGSKN